MIGIPLSPVCAVISESSGGSNDFSLDGYFFGWGGGDEFETVCVGLCGSYLLYE